MELDLTIAGQLSQFEDPSHFAATDLIRALLIYHISATNELSTHLHLSRQVISRCTLAFQAIHQLLSLSSLPGMLPLTWDIFDAYAQGIPILESILMSFETADSYTQQKHLPVDSDVLGALRFIFLWDQERTQLVDALKRLASDDFLGLWERIESKVDANTKEILHNTRSLLQSTPFLEIARDDLTTLTVLWHFFDNFSSDLSLYDAVPKSTATKILDVIQNISLDLHSQTLIDQSSQIFTKSLMLITIPFSLLSNNRSNPNPLDYNTKKHLAREEIWNSMQKLAAMLWDAVNDKTKWNNLNPFQDEYACLRKLLLSDLPISKDPLVHETLQLLQLSAQIFRRFQQRSVALIKLLHFLDQESSAQTVPTESRDQVRLTFLETIRLLKVTEEMFRGRSLGASLTDEEYQDRAAAFETVFSKLRQCGKLLDPSSSWLSKEAQFLAGVELDETHMKEQEQFQLGS